MRRLMYFTLAGLLGSNVSATEQSLTVDLLYTSDDVAHFGEYNDLNDQGTHLLGALNFDGALPWSKDGFARWSINARNLGIGTYDAALTAYKQGSYEVSLTFDGLRQFKRGDAGTPFTVADSLVLPSAWVAGPTTGDLSLLGTALQRFYQRKKRDIFRFETYYRLGPNWSIDAVFRNEDKSGKQVFGGAMFVDASRGSAALLPAPIDYRTQDFSSTLRYAANRFTASLAYLYTNFKNDQTQITWDNPFSGVVDPVADYPGGRGSMSLAPDYDRHQFRIDGSLIPFAGLDLQWNGAWSSTRQDDEFSPYTINPALQVDEALPRDSLDGELTTRSADVRLHYRPPFQSLRKFSLRTTYHYDQRDYDKPRDSYRYVRGDGANQPRPDLSIYNTSYDNRREGFDIGADYRLPWWRGKLSLEYQYLDVERSNLAVDRTETDTYRAVLRMTPFPSFGTRLEWSFSDRNTSTYDWSQSFFSRRTTDYINLTPDDQRFDNHPALRQYNLANAEIDAAELNLSYSGIDLWHFTADIEWRDLNFDHSQMGLLHAESWRYGFDVQYTPSTDFTMFTYVSFTRYDTDSAGRSFGGGIEKPANRVTSPLPQGSDPARDWATDTKDDVQVFGVGMTWRYSERLDLEAGYTLVVTDSGNSFSSGGSSFLVPASLPDIETKLHDLTLSATYIPRDDVRVSCYYRYYRYYEDDWAYDEVTPATLPDVITLGERADNENVNAIGISVQYAF